MGTARLKKQIPTFYRSFLADRKQSTRAQVNDGKGLSWRGFWTGIFLSLFLAVGAPYAETAMHATFMAWDFSSPGAVFLFLVLIGPLNMLYKLCSRHRTGALIVAALAIALYLYHYTPLATMDIHKPGWFMATFLTASAVLNAALTWRGTSLALGRPDLVLVYIMLLMVSALCSMGMSEQLLPIITSFFYYASPQNQWTEKLLPLFPKQNILVNDGQENTAFFEGVGPGSGSIDYSSWIEPLCWWGLFLLALYTAMICIAVILRRQWMERERLAYPVTQVGLAMIEGEDEKTLLNRFFKNRATLYGMAIPLFVGSLQALNSYSPGFPSFNLLWSVPFLGHQSLQLRLSFMMIGFSYFINTTISGGLWVFQLLSKLEGEVRILTGLRSDQRFVYGIADQAYLAYQGGGALLAMVLIGLWTGRQHLQDVFGKALGRRPNVDDSDEIMSYRTAVFGLTGGTVVMVGWMWLMGTKLWVAALFIVLALLIFIGISRVVAEAGLAAGRSPMIAPDLVIQGLGSNLIGASSVFNLSLAYIWCADIRIFIMAMCANGLKLIEDMDRRSRRMGLWGIYLAICIGAVGSCWMVFHMAYRHGGINLVGWFFNGSPNTVYDTAIRNLEPAGVAWDGLGFFFGGAVFMGLLTWARLHFMWWPLHPLGFALAANHMMEKIWFNILIAWFIKRTVLRYGGLSAYQTSQRFFLGLIAGEGLCNGLWIVIDYFTGKTGNIIFILG